MPKRMNEENGKEGDASSMKHFISKHRRLLGEINSHFHHNRIVSGVAIPFIFFQTFYWLIAFRYNLFYLYEEKYILSIVMVFGALIGGEIILLVIFREQRMTTEGGGAIAFPVMTIALNISPMVARDFSLMIQSCGIFYFIQHLSINLFHIAALKQFFHSIAYLFVHEQPNFNNDLDHTVVLLLQVVDDFLSAAQKKMIFVSIFFSFALALYLLNYEKKRITFDSIQQFTPVKAILLVVNGFVGGIFTGFSGSGVDVYSFSILTLLFRISEKVATPTSVVLMAVNSMFGFFWRRFMDNDISEESWQYLAVCVPIVVLFAPLGSFAASHFHRLTLAVLIYVLETVALVSIFKTLHFFETVGAVIVIRPPLSLLGASAAIIIASFIFYYSMSRYGHHMANHQLDSQKNKTVSVACIS
ncbi:unnamed protein product [Anisakis simplex]|uniref:Transporter n=1 Tax=Anisakis simplex TaxID=6269 RepID=A0A0M3JVI6_ANISI|nr:unnamed protein product [Anisakis simplex]